MKKWFIAYGKADFQRSDAEEVAALFGKDELLVTYPLPVMATDSVEGKKIADDYAALGMTDDVGDIVTIRGSRTCWLERLS